MRAAHPQLVDAVRPCLAVSRREGRLEAPRDLTFDNRS